MKKLKAEKGITLVALILTIVILLIISAVAMQQLSHTGVTGHAEVAASQWKEKELEEEDDLDKLGQYFNSFYNSNNNDSEEDNNTDDNTETPHTHTEVTVAGKAATCTETGLTAGKKCSVCNEVLVEQTTIAATGHTYVVKNSFQTCTQTVKDEECSSCGDTKVEYYDGGKGHSLSTSYIPIDYNNGETYEHTELTTCSKCSEYSQEKNVSHSQHTQNSSGQPECICGAAYRSGFWWI